VEVELQARWEPCSAHAVLVRTSRPGGRGATRRAPKRRVAEAPAARGETVAEQVEGELLEGEQAHPGELEAGSNVVPGGSASVTRTDATF
jgi:hypothetical protein